MNNPHNNPTCETCRWTHLVYPVRECHLEPNPVVTYADSWCSHWDGRPNIKENLDHLAEHFNAKSTETANSEAEETSDEPGPDMDRRVAEAIGQLAFIHARGKSGGPLPSKPYSTCWNAAMEGAEKAGLFYDGTYAIMQNACGDWQIIKRYDDNGMRLAEDILFVVVSTGPHSIAIGILKLAESKAPPQSHSPAPPSSRQSSASGPGLSLDSG